MKIALVLIIFSLSLVTQAFVVRPDIVYDRINGVELALDLYTPSRLSNVKLPVLVFIHGGCFNAGSRKAVPNEVKAMADEGFVVVSVGYRLAQVAKYPAAVTDVQQAIRYLRRHADQLSIDANKIAVHGESAGGYLAATLGLRSLPDRRNNIDSYSGRVQVVSDWFGRTDFTLGQTTGNDCAEIFLGKTRSPLTMTDFKEASLLKDAGPNSASFVIVHGTNDQQVYPIHSTLLANQLWKIGKPASLFFYENAGHGFSRTTAWKVSKNHIRSVLGLPMNASLATDFVYRVNFNLVASGRPRGQFNLNLVLGSGPKVAVFPEITERNFDSRLELRGAFGVISTTGQVSLATEAFSLSRDQALIQTRKNVVKLSR